MLLWFGLDLGIKRGAICRLMRTGRGTPPLVSFLPWSPRLDGTPLKDSNQLIRIHVEDHIEPWAEMRESGLQESLLCFGDWTVSEVHWGRTNKTSASLKSYLAGLYTGFLSPAITVAWISPAKVRESLRLAPTAQKPAVWAAMEQACGLLGPELFSAPSNDHEKDALTLALLAMGFSGNVTWMTLPMLDFST